MADRNIQDKTSNTKRFSFYENFDGRYHKVGEIRELIPQFKAFYYAEKRKDPQRSAIKIINDFNQQIAPLTFFPWEKQYRLWRKKWDAELLAVEGTHFFGHLYEGLLVGIRWPERPFFV